MIFKKWHSIENSYRQKYIDSCLDMHPELRDETYIITEKLHGSNFSWVFSPGFPIRAASRNNYLDVYSSFQGVLIPQLMTDSAHIISCMQKHADLTKSIVRLYGELIGRGIQKGVDYGDTKRILYFGVITSTDDLYTLLPFEELEEFLWPNEIVPVVAKVKGLQATIDFDTDFDSLVVGKPDNICEGVIIQPHTRVYYDGYGSPFLLKKKNEKFKEKARAKKPRVVDSEVERLNLEFLSYLTDNRLQSVFSKQSEIENPSQIGNYIRLVLVDAKEDFVKDFCADIESLNKSQKKQIFNVGSTIANMLKAYL